MQTREDLEISEVVERLLVQVCKYSPSVKEQATVLPNKPATKSTADIGSIDIEESQRNSHLVCCKTREKVQAQSITNKTMPNDDVIAIKFNEFSGGGKELVFPAGGSDVNMNRLKSFEECEKVIRSLIESLPLDPDDSSCDEKIKVKKDANNNNSTFVVLVNNDHSK